MDEQAKNNILYVCTLIEYLGRYTKNHREYIVKTLGKEQIKHQLDYADINHCLSLEQVSEELIEAFSIQTGDYDTVSACKYRVPNETAIGKVYQRLVLAVGKEGLWEEAIYDVFASFISDLISNYNTSVYYSSPDYLFCSYEAGALLAD